MGTLQKRKCSAELHQSSFYFCKYGNGNKFLASLSMVLLKNEHIYLRCLLHFQGFQRNPMLFSPKSLLQAIIIFTQSPYSYILPVCQLLHRRNPTPELTRRPEGYYTIKSSWLPGLQVAHPAPSAPAAELTQIIPSLKAPAAPNRDSEGLVGTVRHCSHLCLSSLLL